jgi:hypothetical protein
MEINGEESGDSACSVGHKFVEMSYSGGKEEHDLTEK